MKRTLKVFLPLVITAAALIIAACNTQGSSTVPSGKPAAPVASRTVTPLRPGTYTEDVAGNALGFKVEVVLSANRIEKVTVVSHNDTPGIAQAAIDVIPAAIVSQQSTGIDVVAGASRTSGAIIAAVEKAITDAGGRPQEYRVTGTSFYLSREALLNPVGTPRGPVTAPGRWDETYDVVVVGAGYAGAAAAYAAQTQGARTVLIEKMPFIGGNSQINGGVWASYTSKLAADLQRRKNLTPDTAAKHIEDTIKGGDYMSREDMVKNMVYGSPFYLDLMLDNGLVVRDSLTMPGGHYGFRTYTLEHEQGFDITEVQKRLLAQSGVTVKLNTKLVRIYRDGNQTGPVVGIAVYTAEGIRTIRATKAVILTTGGFSANIPMRSAQVPSLTDAMPTTNQISQTGEGILYAQEIGSQTMQQSYIQLYPFADPNTGVLDAYAVIPFSGPSSGVVYVDYKGERYVNEGERRDVNAKAAMDSGGFPAFCILDQKIVDQGGFTGQDTVNRGIENGRIFKANTLEELASQIAAHSYRSPSGVPGNVNIAPGTLTRTIETHNGYVRSRQDPAFNKVITTAMLTIDAPPYYAIPQWPSVHHTMGGLITTNKLEVVDLFGNVIPNFFAAGEVTGGVHGTNRLGSNAGPDACVNGYIAGYYAVTGDVPAFIKGK
ncbi:MAG: flavocytochrome c [Spirochaetaceae bacterium]|jgi:fumarate reductase flavoprotein subunit|nr:flavocytochrome c [Spirochaetaceae bacterium]